MSLLQLLFLITLSSSAHAGAADFPDRAAVEGVVKPLVKNLALPLVVGIVSPQGSGVHGYGHADGKTIFGIGSVSKVFTGLLLADMVKRGEVSLEDPVQKYLPPGVRM